MPDGLATTAAPAIALHGVSKSYRLYGGPLEQGLDALGLGWMLRWRRGEPALFEALKNIDLDIPRGGKLGIIGRNGAGKTTLLKLITGNFSPTSGTVSVSGRVQALLEMGLGFHPEFTGYDNITASLAYNGLGKAELAEARDDVIEFCRLGEFLRQPLKTYSLGMRARLYFACATAVKPEVLVIDEVLGAGDAYFAARSAARMQRLTANGSTLLLVSHSMPQILQFCTEAIWLERGEIVFRGSALEAIKRYEQFIRHMQEAEAKAAAAADDPSPPAEAAASFEPVALHDDWLENLLRSKVAGLGADADDGPGGMENLSEGGLSRWPTQRGVKLAGLTLRSGENRSEGQVVRSGERFEITLRVRSEVTGRLRCRYLALLFTAEGRWLTRVYSPPDEFDASEGDIREATLRFDELLLGNGSYIFSVAIYDDTPLSRIGEAVCYDLLSRSFEFRVVDRLADDETLFHHPVRWLIGPEASP